MEIDPDPSTLPVAGSTPVALAVSRQRARTFAARRSPSGDLRTAGGHRRDRGPVIALRRSSNRRRAPTRSRPG